MKDKKISTDTIGIEKCTDEAAAPTLALVAEETFTQAFGHLYKQEDLNLFLQKHHTAGNYREHIADPASSVWLAREEDGKIVGYIVAGPCGLPAPNMPENSGELLRFYILDKYKGMGLGKRMLGLALDWLQENYAHLYLSVYAENHSAQRLYEYFGFEKIHKYMYMVGNQADPEFIMKRRSSSDARKEV
ncbi:MAG: GNAT family N-acetyltransferase [Marinicaulis sp.]|nr:GNAT family N-acetyltransferase [Marinicaulis sp.]